MGILKPAYIHVDLEDDQTTYAVFSAPILYQDGEIILPVNVTMYGADSYSALKALLQTEFGIPASMVPPPNYFQPNPSEIAEGVFGLSRTVPIGAGEPEWRTRVRQALLNAVTDASFSKIGDGRVEVDGIPCNSIEALRKELFAVAEKAGGISHTSGESYQPDYDVLVEEALQRDGFLLHHSGLPKKQRVR